MLKPQEKLHKAVGGIIAILFIVSSIIIAYVLIDFGLRAQQEQAEMQQKTYERQIKAISMAKSTRGLWYYDSTESTLTINITNNYVEPIMVTGIVILYTDGSFEVLKENLATQLGSRFLSGTLTLPHIIPPGETLTIKLNTLNKEPASVEFSIATFETLASSSAKKYVPEATVYDIVLAPVAFGEGTVTAKGYALEAQSIYPSSIIVHKGIGDPNNDITYVYTANDGLAYKVTSEKSVREVWLQGWQYRKSIYITNNIASDLNNYQVKIELNSTNFDFTKANSDGSDLRFTLEDGITLIPYWIQEWNSANQRAIIWIKVPQILANSITTIYMYYGNPSATSKSNGDNVFEFFDDFEGTFLNTTKWAVVEQIPTIQNSLCTVAGGDSVEAIRTVNTFTPPFAIHYKLKPSLTIGDWDAGVAVGTTQTQLLGFVDDTISIWRNYMAIMQLWWTLEDSISVLRSDYANFHEYRVIMLSNDNIFSDLTDGRVNNDDYDRSASGYIWLVNDNDGSGNAGIYDWIFVRKYVSPEPTYTLGSEESYYIYVSEIEAVFSNVISDAIRLDFNIRLRFNISNIDVRFYLWNWLSSSWDLVYSETVGTTFSDVSFSTLALSRYLSGGNVRLSINVTHTTSFEEYLDYISLTAYTSTRAVIYIGVGGSNEIYEYVADTGRFEGPITAEYNGIPIIFGPSTSIDYDTHRDLLWVVYGTSLYYYNVTDGRWYIYSSSLPESVSNGCSLIYINNKLFIFIGGNSNRYYIFDLSAWSSQPSGPYNLSFTISDYGVAETDGTYIYILASGGSIGFYKLNPVTLEVTKLNDSPTGYAVGLAYDGDRNRLWLVGKGGGIHYYIINSDLWKPFQYQIPYTPQNQGNRLEYANNKLYHIRDDSTRELWIIYVRG